MLHWRLTACLFVVLALAGGCAQQSATTPSPASAPMAEPVNLRFRPVPHFRYAWTSEMSMTGTPTRFLHGWMMEGEVKPAGDDLDWRYTVFNIGHKGELFELGRVQVLTDLWGHPLRVQIVSGARSGGIGTGGYILDPDITRFRFQPCCLPTASVRAGDQLPELFGKAVADGPRTSGIPSVVGGIETRGGRSYLVVAHYGPVRVSGGAGQPEVVGDVNGRSLIDMATGFMVESAIETAPDFSGLGQPRPWPVLLWRRKTEF